MTKRYILLLTFFSLSIIGFTQKEGSYMPSDSPVDNLWESVDGKDGGAPFFGMSQQFFFLVPDGSQGSMMSPFEDEEYGFACPSYFVVSMDTEFLYMDVHNPCQLDLPAEEKYIKVEYKVNKDGSILTLIFEEEEYNYTEWSYE